MARRKADTQGKLISRTVTKIIHDDGSNYKDGLPVVVDEDTTQRLRLLFAANYTAMGHNAEETATEMCRIYGIAHSTAKQIVYKARANVRELYEINCKEIADRNNARLEQIIKDAYRTGDLKTAISAIQEQNRLNKCYDTSINLSLNEFKIKIGNDDNTPDT